jgi:hypothetical protein
LGLAFICVFGKIPQLRLSCYHQQLILFLAFLLVCGNDSGAAEKPAYNVPEGLVIPLSIETHYTTNYRSVLRCFPIPSGSFQLQQAPTIISRSWADLNILPNSSGDLVELPGADTDVPTSFYRLKLSSPEEVKLSIVSIAEDIESRKTLSFPLLPDWRHFLQVSDANGNWSTIPSIAVTNTLLTLPANIVGEDYRIVAEPPLVREDYEAIVVGGQSNAVLADNIYHLDRVTNVVYLDYLNEFRNPTRFHDGLKDGVWSYAFGLSGATELSDTINKRYLVIGLAVSGTSMNQWMPGPDRYDRSTLFGQAIFRRTAATPQKITAIWYYGHESNTGIPAAFSYIDDWKRLISEFQKEIGNVPVIFAQVAKSIYISANNTNHFPGAEQQRLSEEGQSLGIAGHHMVVTFDLPLADGVHLSGEAHRILGVRFARAMRQHVYHENINGTGPRLVSVSHPDGDKQSVLIKFTTPVNEPVDDYDNQFTIAVGGQEAPISQISRLDSKSAILIRLESPPAPEATVSVSYGAPLPAGNLIYLRNVVRDTDGLPAPRFGPLIVQ